MKDITTNIPVVSAIIDGINKRYFSTLTLGQFVQNFQTLLLDNKGETHKDEIKSLIRFVGKK